MNRILKFVLYYLLVVVVLVFVYFIFTTGRNNRISKSNRLKRQARTAYVEASYKKAFQDLSFLADSLEAEEEEITLNRAHAGYQLSRFDSSNVLNTLLNDEESIDSAYREKMKEPLAYARCIDFYRDLSGTAKDSKVASIAYNQLGVITYRFRDLEEVEKEENALTGAANYFKLALIEFPENDVARYNYELIRRKIDYPEKVISRVKSLINQHRYKEARELLKNALKKDHVIERKYKDYVDRIDNIIRIDSLFRS